MKMGSALRRRRSPAGDSVRPRFSLQALEGRGRLILSAIGLLLLGSGTGYLYATQVAFPAPEEEVLDLREVPDLLNLPTAAGETFIREQGLQVGTIDSIHHPEIPAGWILGQSPLPGQLALPGGMVELTVSLGSERRIVPDVARLTAERALTVLRSAGFVVLVDSIEADLPRGQVVHTLPAAGIERALPSEVRLSVSLGPPMVPMPDLAGLPEAEARILVEALGLVIEEVESRFRFGFSQGEVTEQFPPADSLIPVGSAVRFEIGRRGLF